MISVAAAEGIINGAAKDYGTEPVDIIAATGRVLAEDLFADRDLPPYHRVTMDGIAVNYYAIANDIRVFNIKGTQAAGDKPIEIHSADECIEIMTGAALPASTDTVIRYEDLLIENGIASLQTDNIRQGQNVHMRGKDKMEQEILACSGQFITPALINTAATVGKAKVLVKKLPRVAVLSSGDELVDITAIPTPWEIRRSNACAVAATLKQYGIDAGLYHLPDDEQVARQQLAECLDGYDVLILSGGVSAGKYDHIPGILEELGVVCRFHKVKQRPGKPFWFGSSKSSQPVFAFPGNPVSTFMCMYRYFLPWLYASLDVPQPGPLFAVLEQDYSFNPELQLFLQVKISCGKDGLIRAIPSEGNGSGDFVNLLQTDAFMELPAEQSNFKKGEAYRIWPFKQIV